MRMKSINLIALIIVGTTAPSTKRNHENSIGGHASISTAITAEPPAEPSLFHKKVNLDEMESKHQQSKHQQDSNEKVLQKPLTDPAQQAQTQDSDSVLGSYKSVKHFNDNSDNQNMVFENQNILVGIVTVIVGLVTLSLLFWLRYRSMRNRHSTKKSVLDSKSIYHLPRFIMNLLFQLLNGLRRLPTRHPKIWKSICMIVFLFSFAFGIGYCVSEWMMGSPVERQISELKYMIMMTEEEISFHLKKDREARGKIIPGKIPGKITLEAGERQIKLIYATCRHETYNNILGELLGYNMTTFNAFQNGMINSTTNTTGDGRSISTPSVANSTTSSVADSNTSTPSVADSSSSSTPSVADSSSSAPSSSVPLKLPTNGTTKVETRKMSHIIIDTAFECERKMAIRWLEERQDFLYPINGGRETMQGESPINVDRGVFYAGGGRLSKEYDIPPIKIQGGKKISEGTVEKIVYTTAAKTIAKKEFEHQFLTKTNAYREEVMKPYLGEAHNTHGWSWIYTYDKNVIKYTMQLFATNFDKEYPLSDLPLSWLNIGFKGMPMAMRYYYDEARKEVTKRIDAREKKLGQLDIKKLIVDLSSDAILKAITNVAIKRYKEQS